MLKIIKGKIINKSETKIEISTQNFTFELLSTVFTTKNIEIGKFYKIYVALFLNETTHTFDGFGFLDEKELALFKKLNSISRIGPKMALKILNKIPYQELLKALAENNSKILISYGISQKTALRILVELKSKILEIEEFPKQTIYDEIKIALKNLGFSTNEINQAIKSIPKDIKDEEELLKIALSNLSKI